MGIPLDYKLLEVNEIEGYIIVCIGYSCVFNDAEPEITYEGSVYTMDSIHPYPTGHYKACYKYIKNM